MIRVVLLFVCALLVLPQVSLAQIKSVTDVDTINSRYVVTDSAVIEFLLRKDDGPLKVYDFSTRHVYVQLSQDGDDQIVKAIAFSDMDEAEVDFIRKIGCDDAALSDSFRRFCK